MKIAILLGLVVLVAVVRCETTPAVAASTTISPAPSAVTTEKPAAESTTVPAATTDTPKTTSLAPEPTTEATPAPPVFPSDDSKFPEAVKFNVTIENSNQTCLEAKLAVQFVVANGTKFLKLENAARSDPESTCASENATQIPLKLTFGGNNVTFVFKRNDALNSGWLDSIHLEYHVDNGTDIAKFDIGQKLFESNGTDATHGKRYNCKGEVATKELDGVKAVFKEVEVQVGSAEHGTDLTSCPADEDVNDMIPIAVGAALLALVAIVLVAYFVGRRRSRRLAYQSV